MKEHTHAFRVWDTQKQEYLRGSRGRSIWFRKSDCTLVIDAECYHRPKIAFEVHRFKLVRDEQ